MCRATSSLPVPLSPVTSTVEGWRATLPASASAAASCGLRPTMPAGARSADKLVVQLGDVALELLALDRLAQHEEHLVRPEGLRDEVVGAAPDRLDRAFVVPVGAHHDHERPPVPRQGSARGRRDRPCRACARRTARDRRAIRRAARAALAASLATRTACPSAWRMSESVWRSPSSSSTTRMFIGACPVGEGPRWPGWATPTRRGEGRDAARRRPRAPVPPTRCRPRSPRCARRWRARVPCPCPGSLVVKNGSKMRSVSDSRDAGARIGDDDLHEPVAVTLAGEPVRDAGARQTADRGRRGIRRPPLEAGRDRRARHERRAHGHDAAFTGGIGRIEQEVDEHLLQLVPVPRARLVAAGSASSRARSAAGGPVR